MPVRAGPAHTPLEPLEAKLHPPRGGGCSVPRLRLIERLNGVGDAAVVAVRAPAGYGKTTALTQWAASPGAPAVAWLSLDVCDDDPPVLLTCVATALARVAAIDADVVEAPASPVGASTATTLRRLGAALAAVEQPVALVLDDADAIRDARCVAAIVALVAHLPPRSKLVLAGRDLSAFPLARWRTRALTRELGCAELRMDAREARMLLDATAAGFSDEETAALLHRTEGWPAGLFLAALSARAGATAAAPAETAASGEPIPPPTGDAPFVADFLRAELRASLTPEQLRFLAGTSLLERLSGPLCDAVLRTSGSGALLEALARSDRFVVALDAQRRWYRCHRLVRELLASELERTAADALPALQRRACDWCAEHGEEAAAIGYGQAAGDVERVAALLERCAQPGFRGGAAGAAEQWFRWLRQHGEPQRHPAVGVLAAGWHALGGQPAECELWSAAAERGRGREPLADGSQLASWQALLRALHCRHGAEAMHADASLAVRTLAPASPWRGPALLLLGLAELLRAFSDRADDRFADAAAAAKAFCAPPAAAGVVAVALAERALAASEHGEWAAGDALAEQALWSARHAGCDGGALHALVGAVAARTALHAEREASARELLAGARSALPLLTHVCPVPAVQARLELAQVQLLLGDHAGASRMLGEIDAVLRRCPDLGALGAQAARLRTRLGAPGHDVPGAATLTAAELRVLPLLATHLSYREIGDQRFLSRHTVKSHAMSIYRKLDVNSRNAAVERARGLGLL